MRHGVDCLRHRNCVDVIVLFSYRSTSGWQRRHAASPGRSYAKISTAAAGQLHWRARRRPERAKITSADESDTSSPRSSAPAHSSPPGSLL
eukprot:5021487-Prymnesium_polylepis.1